MMRAAPQLGHVETFSGNVTTLQWIAARPGNDVERTLGYRAGRLALGYWVLLLKQPLTADDIEFDGTTLNSGGRVGLPAATVPADEMRQRVHTQMVARYGDDGMNAFRTAAVAHAKLSGTDRLAKVLPVVPHQRDLSPSLQYPQGGGGLQWKLVRPCRFLVAMAVDQNGLATLAGHGEPISLRGDAPYDNRQRVARFLASA